MARMRPRVRNERQDYHPERLPSALANVPTLEHIDALLQATDDTVVVTIRGIGEMTPGNPTASSICRRRNPPLPR
jgi:hypothetical protein